MSILYLNFNKTMKIACLKNFHSTILMKKGFVVFIKKERNKIERYYFLNFMKWFHLNIRFLYY